MSTLERGKAPSRSLPSPALLALLLVLGSACQQETATPPTPTTPAPSPSPAPPATTDGIVVPAEVRAWLDAHIEPFDGADPSLPLGDLDFLADFVGDARIVALGGDYGTREFSEMRTRILRFLVEEMGFDTFAAEASWAEARRIDDYVRTGSGDPERLLSSLYSYAWRTESALELLEWMRDHNEAGGDLGFHGVSPRFPGLALHDLREYVRFVAPEDVALIAEDTDCLGRFANDHTGAFPTEDYRSQTDAYRTACGASLEQARERLLSRQDAYETAGGADAFAIALQSLLIARQYHEWRSRRRFWNETMADNTLRLRDRGEPGSRMVLWTHNFSAQKRFGLMAYYLWEVVGDDLLVVRFSHEAGRITARRQQGSECSLTLDEFELDAPVADSVEAYFAGASAPRFFLDLRRSSNAAGGRWLSEYRLVRNNLWCYGEEAPEQYWRSAMVPDYYDAFFHFESTGPTTLFPARYPASFR